MGEISPKLWKDYSSDQNYFAPPLRGSFTNLISFLFNCCIANCFFLRGSYLHKILKVYLCGGCFVWTALQWETNCSVAQVNKKWPVALVLIDWLTTVSFLYFVPGLKCLNDIGFYIYYLLDVSREERDLACSWFGCVFEEQKAYKPVHF